MTPYKQISTHNPAEGVWGDCWRTCIACLLDMHPSEVPHFTQISIEAHGADCDGTIAEGPAQAWLFTKGYRLMTMHFAAAHKHLGVELFSKDMPYILSGKSPNYDCNHSTIGAGNFEVIWDPSPSGKGLAGPCYDKDTNGLYYTVQFVVPFNMPLPNPHAGHVISYNPNAVQPYAQEVSE